MLLVWIYRVCMKIYNTDYLVDFAFYFQELKAKKDDTDQSDDNSE